MSDDEAGEHESTTQTGAEGPQLTRIREGYVVDGPALVLGGAVDEATGEPVSDAPVSIPLGSLTRHGLVAGATGTGKTVTLQVMAEELSAQGVPVFLADIKGDLTGLLTAAAPDQGPVRERMESVGLAWTPSASPVELMALAGSAGGVAVRASVSSFGPTLLSKVLGLNATQESSLGLIFHYADQRGLAMLDLKDLRAVIQHLISEEGKQELTELGALSKATAGVILRQLITFAARAEDFFGEPELEIEDLLRADADGRGVITCLEVAEQRSDPMLFSTFLMWLLAELAEELPEVGAVDKPELVFFLDEAHLLFDDASKPFLDAVEQTVRLIRSKGVGVVFVTQRPQDLPEDVLAQLGNRVQHALRAFTPDEAKALARSVRTYPTSEYDLEQLLQQLGTGQAVVTVLDEDGVPTPVAWTLVRAPRSRIGPSDADTLAAAIAASPLLGRYGTRLDRESAYEVLTDRLGAEAPAGRPAGTAAPPPPPASPPQPGSPPSPGTGSAGDVDAELERAAQTGEWETGMPSPGPAEPPPAGRGREATEQPTALERVLAEPGVRSMMRSAGTVLGREITRGLFGTARRRRRRR